MAAAAGRRSGEAGFTRSDAVVTVGGGATTDVGGFVAATWLRGVRVVHVPTTLLGMVDAAVGGKTGINTGAGKNLVGSFHEPAGVLCDLDAAARRCRAPSWSPGWARWSSAASSPTRRSSTSSRARPRRRSTPAPPQLRELVERAIRVKVDVVVGDLRETGGADGHPGREVLNYGHTLAHAIEQAERLPASGTARRSRSAWSTSPSSPGCAGHARRRRRGAARARCSRRVGLPTTLRRARASRTLLATMRVDKKSRGVAAAVRRARRRSAGPRVLAGPVRGRTCGRRTTRSLEGEIDGR